VLRFLFDFGIHPPAEFLYVVTTCPSSASAKRAEERQRRVAFLPRSFASAGKTAGEANEVSGGAPKARCPAKKILRQIRQVIYRQILSRSINAGVQGPIGVIEPYTSINTAIDTPTFPTAARLWAATSKKKR
jgi:hypothetical protein